jgi:hypothetical protein
MTRPLLPILPISLLLAGCISNSAARDAPERPAPPPLSSMAGLDSVMGKPARSLETQFGRPDLDVREGEARKLQFSSQVCVLDAYLYPPSRGGEAVVTHIDARLPDGREMDRSSCIAALHQARLRR